MEHISDQEVNLLNLARELKTYFVAKKSVVEKRPYRPSKRFDDKECWIRTAKTVTQLGASPMNYIEAQFRFAKSAVFANTLHGETAKKRYKQYWATVLNERVDNIKLDEVKEEHSTPAVAELRGRYADEVQRLLDAIGTLDINTEEALAIVKKKRLMFDPLIMMLYAGHIPVISELYKEQALADLYENQCLKQAAIDMKLNLDALYE